MTKADIIESVYEKVGFSKKEAADVVEMVFDTIKETLERGEKIKISGFGNFIVRDKKSRVGPQSADRPGDRDLRPPRAHLPSEPGPEERAERHARRAAARLRLAAGALTAGSPAARQRSSRSPRIR